MFKGQTIQKVAIAAIFLTIVQVAYASFSFTGVTDDRNKGNKYTLKNLNNYSHRVISLSLIKSDLQFKGSQMLSRKSDADGVEMMNSMMQFDRGNTTYIFPYKFKIKLPKDKIRMPIR